MSSTPQHKPDEFPPNNGKVGDLVLVVTHRNKSAQIIDRNTWTALQMKIHQGVITRVGFLNGHGYSLNIEVALTRKKKQILPSVSNTFHYKPTKDKPVVLILVPEDEQLKMLKYWAKANDVIVVRNPAAEPAQMGLRCGVCLGEIINEVKYTEVQPFRWWGNGFSLGKPCIEDSGSQLLCEGCGKKYETPDDVEDYQ